MSKYQTIEIPLNELKKIVYFTIMLFEAESLHMQGTSAKRDLIGGYIERWFNKSAETIVFNDLLKDKDYKVICDYFLYSKAKEKNAPDILGLQTDKGKIIPFVKFKENKWERVGDLPRIEVKVVRKDQWLLGVREPQMIDDYYAFIESDLEPNYLTTIFQEDVFNKKYFDELAMNDAFVESDSENKLIKHFQIKKGERIGSLRLIGIYTKEELLSKTSLAKKDVSPYYFSETININTNMNEVIDSIQVNNDGLVKYSNNDDLYLPFMIKGAEGKKLDVIKKSKSSLYLKSENKLEINGCKVDPGIIYIKFKKFDRSSGWDENIASKFVLEECADDCTKKLISLFDQITNL